MREVLQMTFKFWNYRIIKQEEYDKLKKTAVVDDLTGALRREEFFKRLATKISYVERAKSKVALLLIDVDNMRIHNKKGHAHGDDVLRKVAEIIKSNIRPYDVYGRLSDGSDEFCVALSITDDTDSIGAQVVAARISVACKRADCSVTIGKSVHIGRNARYSAESRKMMANSMYKVASEALMKGKGEKKGEIYGWIPQAKPTNKLALNY
jgi:diguanylate cyclase (GGDEF)-like protein